MRNSRKINIRFYLSAGILLLLCCILFNSCKKEEPDPEVYQNAFTYKKDGILQTVNSISAARINSGSQSYVAISANTSSPSQFVNLWIESSSVSGQYAWDSMGSNYVMKYSNPVLGISYTAKGSNLIISKHDTGFKIIEGTFFGTVYDQITAPTDSMHVTSGSFKIQY